MCGVVAESYQGEGKDKDVDWYRNLTLMAVAALENDVKTVTKLISAGCDPADNQTAFFAGQAGSLSETVRHFHVSGWDMFWEPLYYEGYTALHLAIEAGSLGTIYQSNYNTMLHLCRCGGGSGEARHYRP